MTALPLRVSCRLLSDALEHLSSTALLYWAIKKKRLLDCHVDFPHSLPLCRLLNLAKHLLICFDVERWSSHTRHYTLCSSVHSLLWMQSVHTLMPLYTSTSTSIHVPPALSVSGSQQLDASPAFRCSGYGYKHYVV